MPRATHELQLACTRSTNPLAKIPARVESSSPVQRMGEKEPQMAGEEAARAGSGVGGSSRSRRSELATEQNARHLLHLLR